MGCLASPIPPERRGTLGQDRRPSLGSLHVRYAAGSGRAGHVGGTAEKCQELTFGLPESKPPGARPGGFYSSPAELYIFNNRRSGGPSMTFRKFKTAAIAIRYLIEELPGTNLPGTILEVNEERYRQKQIRKLYDSSAYPLRRQTGEASDAKKT